MTVGPRTYLNALKVGRYLRKFAIPQLRYLISLAGLKIAARCARWRNRLGEFVASSKGLGLFYSVTHRAFINTPAGCCLLAIALGGSGVQSLFSAIGSFGKKSVCRGICRGRRDK